MDLSKLALRDTKSAKEECRGVLPLPDGSEARIERLTIHSTGLDEIRFSSWKDGEIVMRPLDLSESDLMKLIAEGIRQGVLRGDVRRRLWTPMGLAEVLERAAEMDLGHRWELFNLCGTHDVGGLPRTSPAGMVEPPHFCPVCLTVFGADGFRLWNPPSPPN